MKLKPSLDWLLIFVPIAIALRFWPALGGPTAIFVCSAIAIIPVAGWIGHATEALSARVGEGIGGLLNATFGNAAELIIAGIALSKGLTGVVKASITGSIIGNILLVLGLSILFGGTKYKEQRFNRTAARTTTISLSLAAIALIIPTVFHWSANSTPAGWTPIQEQRLSLAIAVILFVTYFCVLWFSLRTHKYFFQGAEEAVGEKGEHWSRGKAVFILLIATAVVAVLSEFLVGSIESVRASFGITEVFVGVVVVAIVGNAAEHSTAIIMAMKNKMNLSVGIAIGSSLQIALFVAPVSFSSPISSVDRWIWSLPFRRFSPSLLPSTSFSRSAEMAKPTGSRECNCSPVYLILGVLFFYLPEPQHGRALGFARFNLSAPTCQVEL